MPAQLFLRRGRRGPIPTKGALLLLMLAGAFVAAARQAPPPAPPGSPIPEGPPPKYEIEADPEAMRQAAAEKAAAEKAAAEKADDEPPVQPEQARLAGEPASRAILEIARLGPGARPEISRQGDRLAFDRGDENGRRALWLSRADGSDARCLSCGLRELADVHLMAPTWQPRGQLLVALGQGSAARLAMDERRLATPARALHSELWAISVDGAMAWELTRAGTQGSAVGDPVFSHEGGRLAFSQRQESEPGPWGKWVVQVAELKIAGGVPRLGKVETFDPSPFGRFVQVAGFTPDDHGLLLVVENDGGGRVAGRYDLRSKSFEPLSRDGDAVTLLAELPRGDWMLWLLGGEVWAVSPSGRGRERLTTWGEKASRYYLGATLPVDLATGPDGQTAVIDLFENRGGAPRQSLFLVRFDLGRLGHPR